LEAIKPKGINRISKISYGYLCPREENLRYLAFHTMSFLFIVCVMPNQPMVDETFVLRSKELEK